MFLVIFDGEVLSLFLWLSATRGEGVICGRLWAMGSPRAVVDHFLTSMNIAHSQHEFYSYSTPSNPFRTISCSRGYPLKSISENILEPPASPGENSDPEGRLLCALTSD